MSSASKPWLSLGKCDCGWLKIGKLGKKKHTKSTSSMLCRILFLASPMFKITRCCIISFGGKE